jgi:hypothetical protein
MVTDKEEMELLERAIKRWGTDAQVKQTIEELAELIVELAKLDRKTNGSNAYAVAQEVADVEIMLRQLRLMFGIGGSVIVARDAKLTRLQNRLDEERKV